MKNISFHFYRHPAANAQRLSAGSHGDKILCSRYAAHRMTGL
jgi:hypothetical protein